MSASALNPKPEASLVHVSAHLTLDGRQHAECPLSCLGLPAIHVCIFDSTSRGPSTNLMSLQDGMSLQDIM